MAILHWAIKGIIHEVTATGVEIKVFTFQPCHLWLRWTTTFPQVHSVPVTRRGLAMYTDKRFCFVAYHDNEQSEGDDTYIHTFLKEPWPACETRYFYFHGKMGGERSKSTSCIFSYHRVAPPKTATFYSDADPESTSVDGRVGTGGGNWSWAEAVYHPGGYSTDSDPGLFVQFAPTSTPGRWVYLFRSILLFDTSIIPPGSTIISASLQIMGSMKFDYGNYHPAINLFSSNPASNIALQPSDYATLGSVPLSSEIDYADWDTAGWNVFTLNAAGLAAITPAGITKLGLRESKYDAPAIPPPWAYNNGTKIEGWSADKGGGLRPKLIVTYK